MKKKDDIVKQLSRNDQDIPWPIDVPLDTEVLYIALGCADYGYPEKLYQAFPKFIQHAIDHGQKVKILAVDPNYGDAMGENGRLPKGGYQKSALANFLETNPQYSKNVSIYTMIRLEAGRDLINTFIANPKNHLILLNFSSCPYQIDVDPTLKQICQKYLQKENVHVLLQDVPGPPYNFDNDALYAQSSTSNVVISLKCENMNCKNGKSLTLDEKRKETIDNKLSTGDDSTASVPTLSPYSKEGSTQTEKLEIESPDDARPDDPAETETLKESKISNDKGEDDEDSSTDSVHNSAFIHVDELNQIAPPQQASLNKDLSTDFGFVRSDDTLRTKDDSTAFVPILSPSPKEGATQTEKPEIKPPDKARPNDPAETETPEKSKISNNEGEDDEDSSTDSVHNSAFIRVDGLHQIAPPQQASLNKDLSMDFGFVRSFASINISELQQMDIPQPAKPPKYKKPGKIPVQNYNIPCLMRVCTQIVKYSQNHGDIVKKEQKIAQKIELLFTIEPAIYITMTTQRQSDNQIFCFYREKVLKLVEAILMVENARSPLKAELLKQLDYLVIKASPREKHPAINQIIRQSNTAIDQAQDSTTKQKLGLEFRKLISEVMDDTLTISQLTQKYDITSQSTYESTI